MGVNTLILQKRKPYVQYIIDVWSPIPFQEAESFSYTPYVVTGAVTATG